MIVHLHVRDGVVHILNAFHVADRCCIAARTAGRRRGAEYRGDPSASSPPANHVGSRTINVMLQVVLARTRSASPARRRPWRSPPLRRCNPRRPASESAAQHLACEPSPSRLEAGDLGGDLLAAIWPCVATQTSQPSGRTSAVQFNGSIGACARIRHFVHRFDFLGRGGSAAGVACFARHRAGLSDRSSMVLRLAAPFSARLLAPSSHWMSSALRPCMALQYSSATTATPFDLHDLLHAGTALAFVASKLATLPPNTGQRASTAVQHPRKAHIEAKSAVPLTLAGVSRRFDGLADQLEIARRPSARRWPARAVSRRPRPGSVGQSRLRSQY